MTAVTCVLLAVIAGCAQSGSGSSAPNTAGNATVVPGEVPTPGEGASGGITVTGTKIVRAGSKLTVTATVKSAESKPDELVQVGSEVTATLNLNPPIAVPAGGSIAIGAAHMVVLDQNARLEPGGTVVLQFQFANAGTVEVFSSFLDTP